LPCHPHAAGFLSPSPSPYPPAPAADIDSIHNDYQRHLPYNWAAPAFILSKFHRLAVGQYGDGHLPEYLGAFRLGPLDASGGRTMADTTTLWLVELYEMYINTGNLSLVQAYWPTAQRAVAWQIGACQQIGLPWHLVSTYDIIDFQQYNASAFNSFVHLAAMRAAAELARAVNDSATAAAADAAFTRGQGALDALLFNTTFSYYRAYTGGEALMGDTLYGQVVALHHGLGWLTAGGAAGLARLSAHLAAELKYNGNAFGIRVVTGRNDPPPASSRTAAAGLRAAPFVRAGVDTTDDTNWQGAGPDWSYVAIQLARASAPAHAPLDPAVVEAALDPARRSMENFRTRLADLWNPTGLTSTGPEWGADNAQGQPYITSHYGFLLVDFYLIGALTGQATNVPAGRLTFDPAYACPYTLPVLLQGTEGSLVCAENPGHGAQYTLTVFFGSLALPAGGLSVAGSAYPNAVALGPGESVTWAA